MTTSNIDNAASSQPKAAPPAAPAEPRVPAERPYSPGLQGVIAAETEAPPSTGASGHRRP